jgi:hypothetical protein
MGVSFHAGFHFFKIKLNIHTQTHTHTHIYIYEDKKMNKQLYKIQNNFKKAFKWYVNSKS